MNEPVLQGRWPVRVVPRSQLPMQLTTSGGGVEAPEVEFFLPGRPDAVRRLHELVDERPELRALLESHVADYGELIPHLLVSEVVDWVSAHREDSPGTRLAVLRWMEHWYRHGSDEVQNLIAASGVEAIPNPGQPGSELHDLLSPELSATDPWNPLSRA